jgi:IS30 family transposase
MVDKGRTKIQDGELNYSAKLTGSDVLEIRQYLRAGFTQRKVATMFGVSNGTINQIKLNKIWKHI